MEQSQQKRTYSLNLASYLIAKQFDYQCKLDPTSGQCFFEFPNTEIIAEAIKEYKHNSPELHSFISAFKEVKNAITKAKEQA